MPSVTLKLPKHVIARPRGDGTFRVYMEVRRNRPPDWPKTIELPRSLPRTGRLDDADELARIFADVEGTEENAYQDGLLAALERQRRGQVAPLRGSLPDLRARWKASDWWLEDIKARTRHFYDTNLDVIEAWSLSKGHPHMREMTLPAIMGFLDQWKGTPSKRGALKRTLSAFFSFARIEGDCPAHPFNARVTVRRGGARRKRPVELWNGMEDVTMYGQAGMAIGWSDCAIMLWCMWETSADESDVIKWKKGPGGNFRDGARPAILYDRGKTGESGVIPISQGLAAAIRGNGQIYFVTDPWGKPYRADNVHDDNRRGKHFAKVRKAAVAAGAPRLLKDHLRHSAITHAVENGVTSTGATALSLHRDSKMIETIYRQLSEKQAADVQRKRGIIP